MVKMCKLKKRNNLPHHNSTLFLAISFVDLLLISKAAPYPQLLNRSNPHLSDFSQSSAQSTTEVS